MLCELFSIVASLYGGSPREQWNFGFSCLSQGRRSAVIDEQKLPSSRATLSKVDAGDDDVVPSTSAPELGA
ncbi:hypothetical protein Taro_003238 [Colocasia esculenta]|uniref:Uncharacterized protein n=1 Tax=Colocasia esculenta TaxID=4460 RepID=A0A843TN58_COLES|nr:hypothetical protein [Colocasia esculenta]